MENQVNSAVSILNYLTASIREPVSKASYLRTPLKNSLESTGDYDESVISRALDRFFGTGLKAV